MCRSTQPVSPALPSTAMLYTRPGTGVKRKKLYVSDVERSSFCATSVRPPTEEPVYTASRVSNVEPDVCSSIGWVVYAVRRNQIEWPPGWPAWLGSPASFVAPEVVSYVESLHELIQRAFAKLSLTGRPKLQASATRPTPP